MTIHDVGSSPVGSSDPAEAADADLVLRSRSGDPEAFGELWRRHYPSGMAVARAVSSSLDADDLVQESFTRIYRSIVTGGGPTGSFRAYLFTSIRNTAASWGRARRETAIDALDTLEDPASSEQAGSDALDRGLTHQAFRSLPTRWQEVLWYSEIEQMKPAEIAPLLGMKPTAVAQLAFRAREGLREAWIQAHLRSVEDGSMCKWTIDRLGAYARHSLSQRDRVKVDAHLQDCTRCTIVASEAREVSSRLALVLLPLTLGATGAAGYLAALHSGSVPAMALAAMPSAVVQGAITVVPAAHAATAAAAGGATGAGSAGATAGTTGLAAASGSGATAGLAGTVGATGVGAAGAATAAAAGSVFTGVGTMAGIATAGIAVVTTVVAGAVGIHALAPPPAVERAGASITQEQVTTDAAVDAGSTTPVTTTDPLIIPPGPDAGTPVTDGTVDTGAPAPVGDPASTDSGAGGEQQTDSGVESSPPATDGSGTTPPTDGTGNQGDAGTTQDPGKTENPGKTEKPGETENPGTQGPGITENPGITGSNGKGNNGTPPGQAAKSAEADETSAGASTATTISTTTLAFASSRSYPSGDATGTTIEVTVAGVPGATLELRVRGRVAASGIIADDGTATLTFQPTAKELSNDARIEVRYVDSKSTGAPLSARLSELA